MVIKWANPEYTSLINYKVSVMLFYQKTTPQNASTHKSQDLSDMSLLLPKFGCFRAEPTLSTLTQRTLDEKM